MGGEDGGRWIDAVKFISLDTETGGLDPKKHALLSISLVHFDTEELTPISTISLHVLPDPGMEIEPEAAAINGYTPELWEERGAIPLCEAMTRISQWRPQRTPVMAHNAEFDRGFIDEAERRSGVKLYLPFAWRCSMMFFRGVTDALSLPHTDAKLVTLATASGHWGPDYARGDHNSLDDALACAAGYTWLLRLVRGQSKEAA